MSITAVFNLASGVRIAGNGFGISSFTVSDLDAAERFEESLCMLGTILPSPCGLCSISGISNHRI